MKIENDNKLIMALTDLCISLSKHHTRETVLEKMIMSIQSSTKADGASLYIKDGEALRFKIIKNKTLNMDLNPTSASIKTLPEISLKPSGIKHTSISAHCAMTKKYINIENISLETNIEIGPTKKFDEKFNYKTKSILAVPVLDHNQGTLGVLQLINAQNEKQSFNEADVNLCNKMAVIIGDVLISERFIIKESLANE